MSRSPSFTVKTELSPKLDPESLRQWVVAFCIIRLILSRVSSLKSVTHLAVLHKMRNLKSLLVLSQIPFPSTRTGQVFTIVSSFSGFEGR
ncbi:hypothetical protein SLA2020_263580 [Shorea laevis]